MTRLFHAIRSGHLPTLIAAWFHLTLSFMVWLSIGALAIPIADALDLSPVQKLTAVAMPLLAGSGLRILAGWASDHFGGKRTAGMILLCELIAALWGWLALGSFPELLVFGLLLGAAGASFATTLPLGGLAYPSEHRGLALGIVASGNFGAVLIAFWAPRWSAVMGWQNVFGVLAGVVAVTWLAFQWLVPSDRPSPTVQSRWWRAMLSICAVRSMYWLCFVYAVTFGGFVGFCSVLPVLFHDHYRVDAVTAGALTALSGLVGSLIRPVGGYAADRVGGMRVLAFACPTIAILTSVLATLPGVTVATLLLIVTVAVMGIGNGAVFQLAAHWFQKQIGLVSGLVGAAGSLGGFLFSISLGWLEGWTGGYRAGLALFAAVAAVATASVGVMRRRERRLAT